MSKAAASQEAESTTTDRSDDPFVYQVQLDKFEGPLDLLLHLIQKHEIDILDIPVHFITQKYLEYLDRMRGMSIDIASEYLVMAAVLTHIKSKMLLPQVPTDQPDDGPLEDIDPREELVRRLLEYQRYKQAAVDLMTRGTLGETVFTRPEAPEPEVLTPRPLAEIPMHALLEAFTKLLSKKKVKVEHEVAFERVTITDRIHQIVDLLRVRRSMEFESLFSTAATRSEIVVTFLALLEMGKLRMVKLAQAATYETLKIEFTLADDVDLADVLPPEL
ncbi:MAG: segregation/condensation protein A [Polyangiaceae bacterium]